MYIPHSFSKFQSSEMCLLLLGTPCSVSGASALSATFSSCGASPPSGLVGLASMPPATSLLSSMSAIFLNLRFLFWPTTGSSPSTRPSSGFVLFSSGSGSSESRGASPADFLWPDLLRFLSFLDCLSFLCFLLFFDLCFDCFSATSGSWDSSLLLD